MGGGVLAQGLGHQPASVEDRRRVSEPRDVEPGIRSGQRPFWEPQDLSHLDLRNVTSSKRQAERGRGRLWAGRPVPAQHQDECCLIVLKSVCGGDHRVMVSCPLVFCPQTAVLRQALAVLGILRREHPNPLCFHQSLANNALQCHTAKCSWGGNPHPLL